MPCWPYALVVGVALSVPSATAYAWSSAHPEVGEEGNRKFPMTAADFRQHVNARLEKARARIEERITTEHLPQDQADGLRAQFKASVAQINTKVDQVCADGTVTKEEAEEVHELVRSLLHGGHDRRG
jgi:hypothetical protein